MRGIEFKLSRWCLRSARKCH